MLQPVNRHRLHDDIILQLQEKILRGEFPPGYKLPPERDLAVEFGVNRSTVREALKKCEALGLLSILHGDGIYVRDYRETGNLELLKSLFLTANKQVPELLDGLMQLRSIIVPPMAAHAASNRNSSELDELDLTIKNNDITLQEKDLLIHRIIARASGNMAYIFLLNYFNDIFRGFGDLYFSKPENREMTIRFHRDILAAIREKNSDRAQKVMKEVLVRSREAVMENIIKGRKG